MSELGNNVIKCIPVGAVSLPDFDCMQTTIVTLLYTTYRSAKSIQLAST